MIGVETKTGGEDPRPDSENATMKMFERIISQPGDGSYYAATIKRDWAVATLTGLADSDKAAPYTERIIGLTIRREFGFGSQRPLHVARGKLFSRAYQKANKENILVHLFLCRN